MTEQTTQTSQQQKPEPGTVHEEIVQEHHDAPTRTICIAVDASSFSQNAFNWAKDNLLRKETDQVVILNCRPFVTAPLVYSSPIMDVSYVYF